jgi:hypothetical protein
VKVSVHRRMTRDALKEVFPELGRRDARRILRGNLFVAYCSYVRYRREFHVLRIPFSPHADAWEMGLLAVQEREARIARALKSGRRRKILREAGALLHTVQDFFSHTNYYTLGPEQRLHFAAALADKEKKPSYVKVCAYSFWRLPHLSSGLPVNSGKTGSVGKVWNAGKVWNSGKAGSTKTFKRDGDGYTHREFAQDVPGDIVYRGALRSSADALRKIRPLIFSGP